MDHKDLKIWKRSRKLCIRVYEITKQLPDHERFGIVSQMQCAAISVPSNVAEGYRRNSPKDFVRFLSIAAGSLAELETQLDVAAELYSQDLSREIAETIETQKMIAAFQKRLINKT